MILRAAYATRGRSGLSRAKAGARSVIHRPSETAQREYRTGFDADYDRMEKDEVKSLIIGCVSRRSVGACVIGTSVESRRETGLGHNLVTISGVVR